MLIESQTIKEILVQILDIKKDMINKINDYEDLSNYGLDSICAIQLVVIIEDMYNIKFFDNDLLFERLNTIEKIKQLISKYLCNK